MRLNLATVWLLVALATICMASMGVRSDEEPQSTTASSLDISSISTTPKSARFLFKLPRLFEFGRFKDLFKKSYKSVVEEMARQKIFLGNAFKAFVSCVSYKHARSSSFRSVNQMSDQTPEEIEKSKVSVQKLRLQLPSSLNRPVLYHEGDSDHQQHHVEEQLPAADLDDIEAALREVEQHRDEPGYREIAEELEQSASLTRSKRSLDRKRLQRQLSSDDLMRSPEQQESPEVQQKIQRRVASNNPQREQPDFTSFGTDDGRDQEKPMSGSVASFINALPGATYLSSVLSNASRMFQNLAGSSHADDDEWYNVSDDPMDMDPLPDHVFVDHRESNCFFTPRNQGQCGSCYAFATVSLYEYLYCRSNGKLVAFSEQYMVDCGPQRTEIDGCAGANLAQSTTFVETFGLELRSDYPYRQSEDQCPYDSDATSDQMGYIKLAKKGVGYLRLDEFDKYLERKPILIGLKLGPEFRHYGGGVDDNVGCGEDEAHAMLIVGHGREDGKEYYLIRNSHGIAWGQAGYYKFNKAMLAKCAADPVGVVATGHFIAGGGAQVQNPNYAGQKHIKRRYREYLLNDLGSTKRQRS